MTVLFCRFYRNFCIIWKWEIQWTGELLSCTLVHAVVQEKNLDITLNFYGDNLLMMNQRNEQWETSTHCEWKMTNKTPNKTNELSIVDDFYCWCWWEEVSKILVSMFWLWIWSCSDNNSALSFIISRSFFAPYVETLQR